MPTFNTYYFNSGTSWRVPEGVTAIQVECFGSAPGIGSNFDRPSANYSGGSYSKSSSVTVTAGATVYMNIGSNGGNTWFNTVNATPTSASSPTSACLAVGGTTVAASQVAANCGNVKYAGGNGRLTTGTDPVILTAQGGMAGPFGPGADVGDPYSNTVYNVLGTNYLRCTGGGGTGGFQGGLGVIPYGRSGTGTVGMGQYYSGADGFNNGTADVLGTYKYRNGLILNTLTTPNGLAYYANSSGVSGGGNASQVRTYGCGEGCCIPYYELASQPGQVVITVVAATQKTIVYTVPAGFPYAEQSFTLPTDFGSLISLEAIGCPGGSDIGLGSNNSGGGGGPAYAKTLAASVTASMVAGSTTVYYRVGTNATSGPQSSYIRIGTSGPPSSVTDGVLAAPGARANVLTGGAGGTTASSVGDTKSAGGNGGNGGATNNPGGGGGAGGPLGAGAAGNNGFASTASRGGGGGGASNGGSAGSAGLSNAGGAGGTITGGTGGTGATGSVVATSGTNGGGGGGGYSTTSPRSSGAVGAILNNGTYAITGGSGGGYPFGGGGGLAAYSSSSVITYGGGVVILAYAPTDGAALTGSSATASSGTLTASQTLTQALSSGSADALAGTLTASQTLTIALSSAIAEAFGGTFVPSNDQVVNLSSVLAAASSGTLTNSQALEIALTGVSADGRTSSFPVFLELVGASAAGATGLFGYVNTGWQPINTAGGSTSWVDVNTQQE